MPAPDTWRMTRKRGVWTITQVDQAATNHRHWTLLLLAPVVGLLWLFGSLYHPVTPKAVQRLPSYSVSRCERDVTSLRWEWLDRPDENGGFTPILCGLPSGAHPQPPTYP